MQHLKNYNCQLAMEVDSTIELPKSRRGVPHSIKRIVPYTVEPGWHLSDDEISAFVDVGISECVAMWKGMLGVSAKLDESKADFFFLDPLQSFQVGDAYLDFKITYRGVEHVVLNELDLTVDGDGIECLQIEAETVESDDQAEADHLIGTLIQKYMPNNVADGAIGGAVLDGNDAGMEAQEQFSSIIAEFNRSIQAGFKDRKLRFRETKLLKDLTAAGHTEQEWKTFSDDEDLTVDFGSHCEVGNVQAIALLTEEPQADQRTPQALSRLSKQYTHSVPINNTRAVFLCKYYLEVNKRTGAGLAGYQNRSCAYKLPLDSDVPYFWVSRMNVMSAVRMPKLEGTFRTRSMAPADSKLSKDLFNKHETYGLT